MTEVGWCASSELEAMVQWAIVGLCLAGMLAIVWWALIGAWRATLALWYRRGLWVWLAWVLPATVVVPPSWASPLTPGALVLNPGLETIAVTASYTGDTNGNAVAKLWFKPTTSANWLAAIDPWIDRRATLQGTTNPHKDQARGMIFSVKPDTAYHVKLEWTDPDGVTGTAALAGATRTVTMTPSLGGAILHVDSAATPGGTGSAAAPFAAIPDALAVVQAGDTIQIASGTYPPFEVTVSGTEDAWIKIVGQGAVLIQDDVQTGRNFNVRVQGAYIWLQNLTGMTTRDYGLIASQSAHHVIFDRMSLPEVSSPSTSNDGDAGIISYGAHHIYVINCHMHLRSAPGQQLSNGKYKGQVWGVYANGTHALGNIHVYDSVFTGDMIDAIGATGNNSLSGGFGPHSTFFRNVVDRQGSVISDNAIEVEGANELNAVVDNVALATREPLGFDATHVGPLYVIRNFTRDDDIGAVKIATRGTGRIYVIHNAFHATKNSVLLNGSTANIVAINNAFVTHDKQPLLGLYEQDYVAYNLFDYAHWRIVSGYTYTPPAGCPASPADLSSLAEFERCGNAEHNLLGSATLANYHTGAPSAAHAGIDRGVWMPNINGPNSSWPAVALPDIGRMEYGR